MLTINNQGRRTGKTMKIISELRKDREAICIVPSHYMKKHLYPDTLQHRVFSIHVGEDLYNHVNRCSKVYIDEPYLIRPLTLMKLMYELGRMGKPVETYGTEGD